jgi:hypothetical protein
VGGAVLAHDRQRLGRGAARSAPVDDQLVGRAGVPAHADANRVEVLLHQQGHVGDQGTQQPLSVAWTGGWRVPQPGQVGGQCAQRVVIGQWRLDGSGGRQRGLGLGEGGEFGLPPCFQRPCDEPVFGLDLAEGAFGTLGLVTRAFDGQLGGAVGSHLPVGDLLRGRQRDLDLVRCHGLE